MQCIVVRFINIREDVGIYSASDDTEVFTALDGQITVTVTRDSRYIDMVGVTDLISDYFLQIHVDRRNKLTMKIILTAVEVKNTSVSWTFAATTFALLTLH